MSDKEIKIQAYRDFANFRERLTRRNRDPIQDKIGGRSSA